MADLTTVVERFAASPRGREARSMEGRFDVVDCIDRYRQLAEAPDHPDAPPLAFGRAAGINDQEDDDNVLWRALGGLGVEQGPQLRVLSRPKDVDDIPALKAAMWSGLGEVHPYDLDAYKVDPRAVERSRTRFLAGLDRFFAGAPIVTLLVTSPLGDHGLLPTIEQHVQGHGQRLRVVFYSGQYNLRRSAADIEAVLDTAEVVDISRHPFMRGQTTPLDNMWSVLQSCPAFDAFCEFAHPQLHRATRAFRRRFNRSLLDVSLVFERNGKGLPASLRRRARELWGACESAQADADALDRYREFLRRDDVRAHLKPWKRSTVDGYEHDAPIADTCIALALLLLRKQPDELELCDGVWHVEGRHSGVRPAKAGEANNARTVVLRSPRDDLFAVFIGMLAAARAFRGVTEG